MSRKPQLPAALLCAPFTTAQARAAGISTNALRGEHWRHLFRNVWAHTDLEDTRANRVAAARLVLGPEGFLCGLTAAWIYGIDVQDRRGQLAWIGRRTGTSYEVRPGCLVREITIDDKDLQLVDGTLVTTPLRTAFDCARWLSLVEAVVVADALAHEQLFNKEELAAYVRSHRRLRGVVQADRVAELVEPLTESPMESRLRLLLIRSGFDAPKPQHEIKDLAGRFVARVDFAYPDQRIVVEYDGTFHFVQRRADDRRRDKVRDLGWKVLVASKEDYYDHPQDFITQLRQAFRAAA